MGHRILLILKPKLSKQYTIKYFTKPPHENLTKIARYEFVQTKMYDEHTFSFICQKRKHQWKVTIWHCPLSVNLLCDFQAFHYVDDLGVYFPFTLLHSPLSESDRNVRTCALPLSNRWAGRSWSRDLKDHKV